MSSSLVYTVSSRPARLKWDSCLKTKPKMFRCAQRLSHCFPRPKPKWCQSLKKPHTNGTAHDILVPMKINQPDMNPLNRIFVEVRSGHACMVNNKRGFRRCCHCQDSGDSFGEESVPRGDTHMDTEGGLPAASLRLLWSNSCCLYPLNWSDFIYFFVGCVSQNLKRTRSTEY